MVTDDYHTGQYFGPGCTQQTHLSPLALELERSHTETRDALQTHVETGPPELTLTTSADLSSIANNSPAVLHATEPQQLAPKRQRLRVNVSDATYHMRKDRRVSASWLPSYTLARHRNSALSLTKYKDCETGARKHVWEVLNINKHC